MEKNSNIPAMCLDCKWFFEKSKVYDMDLPNRCWIEIKEINEAFKKCKGIAYEKR